jgi:peptidoglycan/LPS O-acetylase OafA/YrhL
MLETHDIIGLIGGALILLAFALIQWQRLKPEQFSYSLLNFLGAALILFSLGHDWNLTAAVIEAVWMAMSFYGLIQWYCRRKRLTKKETL